MKTLKESILSSTNTGKTKFLFPKTKKELQRMIDEEIKKNGWNCSLNHIKVDKITDMSGLFDNVKLARFNGDISEWDVSNVTNMDSMFYDTLFNGNISKWNVGKVTNMKNMFDNSEFNGDISKWNVSSVENMERMFVDSQFNSDIKNWYVDNVRNMRYMFCSSNFNKDISKWNINVDCNTELMFYHTMMKTKNKPFKNGKRLQES